MTLNSEPSPEAIQTAIETEFQCHRCGHCCKGDGVVEFGGVEADRMAAYLQMTRAEFLKRYARKYGATTWRLLDQNNPEKWCIFLVVDSEGLYGCSVNPAKPDQCGSFPAKWRNSDSFETCAGLRILMRQLKDRQENRK